MSGIKNTQIKVGKKYFIKIGGKAYDNNQGQVREVTSLTPHSGRYDCRIKNILYGVETNNQDCVLFSDLIPLKDFKYQVGDKVKVKKSYTSTSSKDGKELAGTEQTILKIDEFDSNLSVLITAPEGYRGGFNEISNNYWVSYKDIKIVSRPH